MSTDIKLAKAYIEIEILARRVRELEQQLADAIQASRWESDLASQALADIKKSGDRVAELERDAARYQWLKKEHEADYPMAHIVWKANGDRGSSEWVNTVSPESLDHGIDAVIAKEQTK